MNDRIREVRKALAMNQEDFGAKLGVSRGVIVNAELGRASVNNLFVKHICDIYGVSEHWLETGEGEMFHAKPEPEPEYPPIIQAALQSYMRLNPAEQAAFEKWLLDFATSYGDAARRKAHDDLVDRLTTGETIIAPNGKHVPVAVGEHDPVTMARYLAQQDQSDLAAEETTHPVAAENS